MAKGTSRTGKDQSQKTDEDTMERLEICIPKEQMEYVQKLRLWIEESRESCKNAFESLV